MFNALVFTLILQGGITAAEMGIVVLTSTICLGRCLWYGIYGGLTIVIFVFTIISTIFERTSETRGEQSNIVRPFTSFIAIALRRISLLITFVDAAGLALVSCPQFSSYPRQLLL